MSGQMFKPLILMSILAVSLLFLHSVSVSWASDEAAGAGHELAVIGEAGAKAIDIKISAQKHGGGAPGKDDPVSVVITPSAPAYVTAIYISPEGDAVVLFPNKKTTDNQLAPGKDYTIVSPDSGLKSGFSPTEDKDKIVVYVSSKQLILHPLKAEQDQEFIVIPHDAAKEMQTLANKIAALSKDETFNRKLITRKTLAQPGQGDSIMALPKSVESVRPADVTGGVGVKTKIKASGKD